MGWIYRSFSVTPDGDGGVPNIVDNIVDGDISTINIVDQLQDPSTAVGALATLLPEDSPINDFLTVYNNIDDALYAASLVGLYLPDDIALMLGENGIGYWADPSGTAGWYASGPANDPGYFDPGSAAGATFSSLLAAWQMYNATGEIGNAITSAFFTGAGSLIGGPLGAMVGGMIGGALVSEPDITSVPEMTTMQYLTPSGATLRVPINMDTTDMNQMWYDVQQIQRFDYGIYTMLEDYYDRMAAGGYMSEEEAQEDLAWALRTYNRAVGTGMAIDYWPSEENGLEDNLQMRWEAAEHWFKNMFPVGFFDGSLETFMPTIQDIDQDFYASPWGWGDWIPDLAQAYGGMNLIEGPDDYLYYNTHIYTPTGSFVYTPNQEIVSKENNSGVDTTDPISIIIDDFGMQYVWYPSQADQADAFGYNAWLAEQDPYLPYDPNIALYAHQYDQLSQWERDQLAAQGDPWATFQAENSDFIAQLTNQVGAETVSKLNVTELTYLRDNPDMITILYGSNT